MSLRERMVLLTPEWSKNGAQWLAWRKRDFLAPSPPNVKRAVLRRNGIPGSTWVETGTYLGATTKFLARRSPAVVTIEPAAELYERARRRFLDDPHITVVHGSSEAVMASVLDGLSGDVSFWLDGHFSGGMTFEGEAVTPVLAELDTIGARLDRFGRVAVLIDDIRLFGAPGPEGQGYPPLETLVEWAGGHGLRWHIEHDIFVARSPGNE